MTEQLADLSGAELSAAFASGALSPLEVMKQVLARVERLEPQLCATWGLDAEKALDGARVSEARWRAGTPLGPLDGIPVTLKELIATEGMAKPVGTAAADMTPQTADAPPAARLREAGCVLVAKTTVPDYGMLSSGLSSFHKLARNPWDTTRNPGGSSAGAGAAAAAGYGPFHVGTDIGGSVRLPAGWCGVFAHKPSNGRIPIDPPYIGRVAGPMTRTVTDAALMMSVLSLPDPRDFMDLPPQDLPWLDLDADVTGLRVGLMLDAGCGAAAEPEVVAAIEAAAALFEAGGAIVEPVDPFMTPQMLDGLDRFWRTRFWEETRQLPAERYAKILPYIREWVEPAAGYDGLSVYTGFDQIMQMRERGRAYQAYDLLLTPVAPMPAFAAELPSPTNDPMRPFEHIGFTVPYNMTEQPASSINCGYTREGLPIGLQIVGRRFADMDVLRASRWYEKARPEQRPWPLALG
ncbi:amidase [Novosphingobium sp. 1949]|uniref:Amidase n=1 Tax=Novosphingobium organovorum TaxID=2930092 RepID=A0ABT0BGP6_9SPHN|nr:amidase [Novosphingobium organovorum]MCJ2184242.1 amidase [Novosphingobium organovorum]